MKITSDHLNSGYLHPYWAERVKQDRARSETGGIKQIFIAEKKLNHSLKFPNYFFYYSLLFKLILNSFRSTTPISHKTNLRIVESVIKGTVFTLVVTNLIFHLSVVYSYPTTCDSDIKSLEYSLLLGLLPASRPAIGWSNNRTQYTFAPLCYTESKVIKTQ